MKPRYTFDLESQAWIDLPDVTDKINASRYEKSDELKEYEDYLVWREEKTAFNLDELVLPAGRLITGNMKKKKTKNKQKFIYKRFIY